MSAFALIYIAFISASTSVHAQICIWGATSNSIINGEYIPSGTINSEPSYSKQLPANCSTNALHLYYGYNGGQYHWSINTQTNNVGGYATCDNPHTDSFDADSFDTDPSICDNQWNVRHNIMTSVTARIGSCPSWPCKRISVRFSDNYDLCGMIFDQQIADNAYTGYNSFYQKQMYFYFHEYFMRWICSDQYTKDCYYNYYDRSKIVITGAKQFTDLTVGNLLQIPMEYNSRTATINCFDSPINPTATATITENPTQYPTKNPTVNIITTTKSSITTYDTSISILSSARTTKKDTENTNLYISKIESADSTLDYVIFSIIGIILCLVGILLGYCFKRFNDNSKTQTTTEHNLDFANESTEIEMPEKPKEITLTQNELIVQKMKQRYMDVFPSSPSSPPSMQTVVSHSNSMHSPMPNQANLQFEGKFSYTTHKNQVSILDETEGDIEIIYKQQNTDHDEKNHIRNGYPARVVSVKSAYNEAQKAYPMTTKGDDNQLININKAQKAYPMTTRKEYESGHKNEFMNSDAKSISEYTEVVKCDDNINIGRKAYPMSVMTSKGAYNNNINIGQKAYPMTTGNGYESKHQNEFIDNDAKNAAVYIENTNVVNVVKCGDKSEKAYPMNGMTSKGGYNETINNNKAYPMTPSRGNISNLNSMKTMNEKAYPMSVMTSKGAYDDNNIGQKAYPMSKTKGIDSKQKAYPKNTNMTRIDSKQKAYPMSVTTKYSNTKDGEPQIYSTTK